MKVLFVCVANVGRSQMAEALLNKISRHQAGSAGTRADQILAKQSPASTKLLDGPRMAQVVVRCLQEEEGIDISQKERKQLTEQMYLEADKVVLIADRGTWPEYVSEGDPRVIAWDVHDPVQHVGENPDDEEKAYTLVCEAKERIKRLVTQLIKDLAACEGGTGTA